MSKLSFVKYQGAGNDFILIDDRALQFNAKQVPILCDRKIGIGADGVILLQRHSNVDFRMRIFNKDGSEPESCGNGLRCFMQFLLHLGFPKKGYRIALGNRVVEADFIGEKIRVKMGSVLNVKRFYICENEVYSLDTGVPHVVIFVPDVQKIDLVERGRALRYHPLFLPKGTNVNFASIQKDRSICVRTYERGLEGESSACGTGAAAVGFVASKNYGTPNPIRISFAGGDIEIQIIGYEVVVIGDAYKIFEGIFFGTEFGQKG